MLNRLRRALADLIDPPRRGRRAVLDGDAKRELRNYAKRVLKDATMGLYAERIKDLKAKRDAAVVDKGLALRAKEDAIKASAGLKASNDELSALNAKLSAELAGGGAAGAPPAAARGPLASELLDDAADADAFADLVPEKRGVTDRLKPYLTATVVG